MRRAAKGGGDETFVPKASEPFSVGKLQEANFSVRFNARPGPSTPFIFSKGKFVIHEDKPCPDCDGTMKPVRLIDKSFNTDEDVEYTVPDAKRSFWTGKYLVEGRVAAFMCDSCGRMLLYGQSKDA